MWINSADLDRLSLALNIQQQQFLARYTKSYSRRPGWWLLRNTPGTQVCSMQSPMKGTVVAWRATGNSLPAPVLQDCIFLEEARCTVHAAKPVQCATYPWWPELMEYWAWESERESTCEGLDHPDSRALDADHAAAQLRAATEHFAARDAAGSEPKHR